MKIRPYKLSDFDMIGPLYDESIQLNQSQLYKMNSREIYLEWLRRTYDDKNSIVFIVEKNGSIIGFAVGLIKQNGPLLLPDKVGYVGMFIVDSMHRRKGIGRSLYQRLLDWFISKEISEIQLTTEINNATARQFWDSFGFNATYEERSIKI